MTHMTKLALAILSVLALPTLGRAQNLLVRPGFEIDNIVPLSNIVNPNMSSGRWGVEQAVRDMGPTSGIIPHQGSWMLKMDDDGLTVTQAFQFVDISNRGNNNTLEVEAWFNSDALAPLAADFGLRLDYYVDANSNFTTPMSLDGRRMVLDNDVTTWQGLFFRSTIPATANWVGIQVNFRNDSIGIRSGFVDSVSLVLVPAPGSMLAFGIGLASLVVRRRRK